MRNRFVLTTQKTSVKGITIQQDSVKSFVECYVMVEYHNMFRIFHKTLLRLRHDQLIKVINHFNIFCKIFSLIRNQKIFTHSETLQARLVGGSNELEGTVEVNYNGTWGTVCSGSRWDIRTADVICKMLGHKLAISAPRRAHFGHGNGEIILGNVYCKGTETNIGYCNHDPYSDSVDPSLICLNHFDDAGVACSSGLV